MSCIPKHYRHGRERRRSGPLTQSAFSVKPGKALHRRADRPPVHHHPQHGPQHPHAHRHHLMVRVHKNHDKLLVGLKSTGE